MWGERLGGGVATLKNKTGLRCNVKKQQFKIELLTFERRKTSLNKLLK